MKINLKSKKKFTIWNSVLFWIILIMGLVLTRCPFSGDIWLRTTLNRSQNTYFSELTLIDPKFSATVHTIGHVCPRTIWDRSYNVVWTGLHCNLKMSIPKLSSGKNPSSMRAHNDVMLLTKKRLKWHNNAIETFCILVILRTFWNEWKQIF